MTDIAQALAPIVAAILEDARVAAALRALLAPPPAAAPIDGLVAKADAARALGVSVATVDRFVREGAPVEVVGARRRFDVVKLRAWCTGRGRRAAQTTKRAGDTIDVADVAGRAGLRAVR